MLKHPIIIETKSAAKISNDARLQLQNYLISLPLNSSEVLHQVGDGILLNWRNNLSIDEPDEIQPKVESELWSMKKNKMNLIFKIPQTV